jgi:hypothetical protein
LVFYGGTSGKDDVVKVVHATQRDVLVRKIDPEEIPL